MKQKQCILAAIVALGLQAGVTHAQSTGWIRGMDTNLYIGGNVGQVRYRSTCDNVPVPCDDKDTGWRAFAGFRFHPNVAVEAGYFDLGKATAAGTFGGAAVAADAQVTGAELTGLLVIPVWQQLSVFGRAGVARTRVKVSGTAVAGAGAFSTNMKETSTDFTYGVGAQYALGSNVDVRLEWQRYDSVGGGALGKEDLDLFSLGLLYRF